MTAGRAAEELAAAADWRDPDAELPIDERPAALVELGAAVGVHTEDVGLDGPDLVDAYADILTAAAACSGGTVVVEDIAFTEQEDEDASGDWLLTFTRNGQPMSWTIDDHDEYLDTLSIFESINDLRPPGDVQRRFHRLSTSPGADQVYVLASDAQLAVITGELGLSLLA
ncbi:MULTISPECIES: hypothetical protein [Saccharothrix]|uniref:hypothetical protein n=1 Tax=Saccharothrix TaxID=2071 RepID=UPI001160F3B1|nr:hypothetical protein [Saccharothrix sp. CB00851]